MKADDPNLGFQAARALCRLAPTDAAARAATIEAVMAHPWFARLGGSTSARRHSYRAVALSLLGKDAIPQLRERANAVIEAGSKVAKGSRGPDYTGICEVAAAAFVIDPASASEFLPILAKIPNRNPPVVDRTLRSLTTKDLEGKLDQRDPLGRAAAKKK